MKILWLTWKDKSNPLAGGAEVVNEELAKRLVLDGHEVIFLVANYSGGQVHDQRDGFKIIRVGSRISVYWHAYKYYKKNLDQWPELVIEEVNTIPFFSGYYTKKKTVLIFYMLCRQIWFYQLPFPLSLVGYFLEPLYLRLLNRWPVVTISKSSREDLINHGFIGPKTNIIPMASEIQPLSRLDVKVLAQPVVLSLGAIRPMKQTLDQIKAFELAKTQIPELKLWVAGDSTGKYGQKVINYIANSKWSKDIEYFGKVSLKQKTELMKTASVISVTSVKEGWGLIVTEAASQGTPAIVYDADGLRDSVEEGVTGLVVEPNPSAMGAGIIKILSDQSQYNKMRTTAWSNSSQLNFDHTYDVFKGILIKPGESK